MQRQLPYPFTGIFFSKNRLRKKIKTALLYGILMAFCLVPRKETKAQTIQFTSTPKTAATENVPYSTSIMATITNNDPLTFSAPVLPDWLSLDNSGAVSGTKINNDELSGTGAGAVDGNGNYYAVSQGGSNIYKIKPDGTSTLWATKSSNSNSVYGALVVDNYLYVSYYYHSSNIAIERFDITSSNPVPETVITNSGILSMVYKDGYLYGANYLYNKIVKVNLSNKSVTDYVTGISGCWGLSFTASGDLLIALYGRGKIIKYSNGVQTDLLTDIPSYVTDVKIDDNGYTYVSEWGGKIRKYRPDLSSYIEVSEDVYCGSMTLSPQGVLVYTDANSGNLYALQTGVVLKGTPSHEDVGDHPVKIIATNGTVSKEQEFVITVTDPNPPVVVSYSPATDAEEVELTPTLSLVFNETIVKKSGSVYIKSDEETLETININSDKVTISDKTLTITLSQRLPGNSLIYVNIDAGAVEDVNGNDFAGINNSGTWSFTTIQKLPQAITFDAEKTVTYGVGAFDPGAISDAELAVTYSSSDESVAIIENGKIKVLKAGVTTITASQEGNDDYLPAEPVSQELTVNKATLTIKADSKTRKVGQENPVFTFTYTGWVNGDSPSSFTTGPKAQTTATAASMMGKYDITVSGAVSPNYDISYENGELTVLSDQRLKVWPSSNNSLEVRLFVDLGQKASVALYTESGQPVHMHHRQLHGGFNSFTITGINVAANVYILHITGETFKEVQKVKIK